MIELPEIKRTLYYVIKKTLLGASKRPGIYTLMGLKGVGKTTLMKQLCQDCRGVYLNARVSESDKGDLYNKLNYVLNSQYSFVCIDNLLELPYEIYEFLRIIDDYSDKKTIVIAGDTSVLLHDAMESLDITNNYLMMPINYYEYCTWFDEKVSTPSYYEYLRFKRTGEMVDAEKCIKSAHNAIADKSKYYSFEIEEIIKEAGKTLRDCNLTDYLRGKAQRVDYANLRPFEKDYLEVFLSLSGFALKCTQYLTKAVEYKSVGGEPHLIESYKYLHYLCPGFHGSMTLDTEYVLDCFNFCCYYFGVGGRIIDELSHTIEYVRSNLAVKVFSKQEYDALYRDLPYYFSMIEAIRVKNLIFATTEPTDLELSQRGVVKMLVIPLPTLMYTLGEMTLDDVDGYVDDTTLDLIYQKALKIEEESKR